MFSGLTLLDRNQSEGRFTAIRLRPASSTERYIALVFATVIEVSTCERKIATFVTYVEGQWQYFELPWSEVSDLTT